MFGKDYAGDMIRVRQAKRAIGIIITLWLLGIAGVVSFWGAVIWAAIHFIKKYW